MVTSVQNQMEELERIKESALRIAFWEEYATDEELLTNAGLTTLYNRSLQNKAIMKLQVKNKLLSSYVRSGHL